MSTLTPFALSSVPFHEDTLEAMQTPDGQVWVVLRHCCECLGIDVDAQRKRLTDSNRSPWATTAIMTAVAQDGRQRDVMMIALDSLPMWLATIEVGRVSPLAQGKLTRYQRECAVVLREHFFGARQTDPIIALLDSVKEVRLAQLDAERKIAAARDLADQARAQAVTAGEVAQAAFDTVSGNHGYYSVLGYLKLLGREATYAEASRDGKILTRLCREQNIPVHSTRDQRFGEVNIYPETLLASYYQPLEE